MNCMNQRRAEGKFALGDAGFELVGELMLALLNEVTLYAVRAQQRLHKRKELHHSQPNLPL